MLLAISYTLSVIRPYRVLWRGAERIIRGGDYFDNIGGNNYNESMLLGKELGFAKPYTQFLDYRPYRSRQINPR